MRLCCSPCELGTTGSRTVDAVVISVECVTSIGWELRPSLGEIWLYNIDVTKFSQLFWTPKDISSVLDTFYIHDLVFACHQNAHNQLMSTNHKSAITIHFPWGLTRKRVKFWPNLLPGTGYRNKPFWITIFFKSTAYIRKEKSNLPGSIFPGCTTAGLVTFASAAVCTVFTCIQQFNANCLSRSIQIDFIPLHFSLWILLTRKNKSG